mmetsp:Transcript_26350/g.40042  ORF Transcript_26350/g.40042 Transcript_26350/m.40042 type:complete len:160 (+) Transcript_26350:92-571(+)
MSLSSRVAARIPAFRTAQPGRGRRAPFRLAPAKDDLRNKPRERGRWVAGMEDFEDEEDYDYALQEEERQDYYSSDGVSALALSYKKKEIQFHEECYGNLSKADRKAQSWGNDVGSRKPEPPPASSAAALLAAGQPKDKIYQAIREAYDVQTDDDRGFRR